MEALGKPPVAERTERDSPLVGGVAAQCHEAPQLSCVKLLVRGAPLLARSLHACASMIPLSNHDLGPDDAMTSSPVPLCFIDYLCAERGIEREYALELVGTYLITRSAAARGEPVPGAARDDPARALPMGWPRERQPPIG